jgi:hypothetical protein
MAGHASSGHAHLYERYTRTVKGKQITYLVAGMGGYYNLPGLKPNRPPVPKTPASGTDASGNPLRIESITTQLSALYGSPYRRL